MLQSSPPLALDAASWAEAPQAALRALRDQEAVSIAVDAAGDAPVSAQVAQLLLAAQVTARARGGDLRLEEPSPSVLESLKLLGLTDLGTGERHDQ